jgi:hypothetical protein
LIVTENVGKNAFFAASRRYLPQGTGKGDAPPVPAKPSRKKK